MSSTASEHEDESRVFCPGEWLGLERGCAQCRWAQDGEGLNPQGHSGMAEKEEARAFVHSIHFTNTC